MQNEKKYDFKNSMENGVKIASNINQNEYFYRCVCVYFIILRYQFSFFLLFRYRVLRNVNFIPEKKKNNKKTVYRLRYFCFLIMSHQPDAWNNVLLFQRLYVVIVMLFHEKLASITHYSPINWCAYEYCKLNKLNTCIRTSSRNRCFNKVNKTWKKPIYNYSEWT